MGNNCSFNELDNLIDKNVETIRIYVKNNPGMSAIELTNLMERQGMKEAKKSVLKFLKQKY